MTSTSIQSRDRLRRSGVRADLRGEPDGPLPLATGEWIELRLRFAAVKAARTLLSFGANVEVLSPPEVRAELAAVAMEIVELYSNLRLG